MATSLVFDLDGTLVETAEDLIDTLNFVLKFEDVAPLLLQEGRLMVGQGGRALIVKALAKAGKRVDPLRLEVLFERFLAHYNDHLADKSHLYPCLKATLTILQEQGFILAVCTNKRQAQAKTLLKAMKIDHFFAAICGQDSFEVYKPDPRALRATIQQAGGDPNDAIMIGDSQTDIDTARNAKLPVIAVDFGYSEVPIASLNPDYTLSDYKDLPALISQIT